MTGIDKARKVANDLRTETQEKQAAETTAIVKLKAQLAKLAQNPEMAKTVSEDAKHEQEKSGGSLPLLKVYVANKSTQTLADGKEPNDGWFYYSPTQEQYQEIHCHILTVSRGFRMPGMPDEKGEVKNRWNHIVAGIMLNDEPKPFWVFVSGQARVTSLWEFQSELRQYNRIGLPTFPLIIKLTTEKVKTEKSPARVIKFEVEKGDDGFPMMVEDPAEYMRLREKVYEQEGYIEQYINRKEVIEATTPKKIEAVRVEE